jgi:hypothetical protein
MFAGAVGSCDVVDSQVGVLVDGGAIVCALACVTLGDGPSIDTLGSGVAGDCVRYILGEGVSVASGRRISRSFSMACVRAREALVEVGTVPPRAVRCLLLLVSCTLLVTVLGRRSALNIAATCQPPNIAWCRACKI